MATSFHKDQVVKFNLNFFRINLNYFFCQNYTQVNLTLIILFYTRHYFYFLIFKFIFVTEKKFLMSFKCVVAEF